MKFAYWAHIFEPCETLPMVGEQLRTESRFIEVLADMLKDERFQFPLAAAQHQYRANYYGMTSAALLEVVYIDALTQFLNTSWPDIRFARAPLGEKHWDYRFEDIPFSHKVGKGGAEEITVLWDATVEAETWTVENSVVFQAGNYGPRRLSGTVENCELELRSLDGDPNQVLKLGQEVLLVSWGPGNEARILDSWSPDRSTRISEQLDPQTVHRLVAEPLRNGTPANHLEFLEVTKSTGSGLARQAPGQTRVKPDGHLQIGAGLRPGIYVIPQERLVDVPIKRNNRGLQIRKAKVAEFLLASQQDGLFVPMPTWWGAFADSRPPDLFLPQIAQYDSVFSRGV